jgi:4'-phosphopantetheinyl transferase
VTKMPTRATCEVWLATLDQLRPDHLRVLDSVEADRLPRFTRPADAARCALGAVVLRLVAGHYLNTDPGAIVIDRTCPQCGLAHGKPSVAGGPEVSVAHSGDLVVVAVTAAGPVGVDVESVTGRPRAQVVRALSGDPRTDADLDIRDLLTYWTRRETVTKATGEGLDIARRDVVVSAPADPARLIDWSGRITPNCALVDLELPSEYVGCVAVLTSVPVDVRVCSALRLLTTAALVIAPVPIGASPLSRGAGLL